ncbi:MAG: UDP-N-acetylmuramate dehydrogenase [Candidatus Carbobacillus altaicus]|nr:UDP-N-acetylmuramate dehydrogenase [Candidatus Carbobacillus altaicus]
MKVPSLVSRLSHYGTVREHVPLARYTTWKIGGPADIWFEPAGTEALAVALQYIREAHVPWMIIGKGSNMLILDGGFRGVVIHLGEPFVTLRKEGATLIAGGAYPLVRLAYDAVRRGLSGLTYAGGIPGSVGGAVVMNAGAHGQDTSRVLSYARIVWEDGRVEILRREALEMTYRTTRLQRERGVVVEAAFDLTPGDEQSLRKEMNTLKTHRLRTQPLQEACAGSVFRNPPGDYAARLIEACGLKGTHHGGAQISELHANFIINRGAARASDVLHLIHTVQSCVKERFGIELKTEVLVMGEG